MRFHLGAHNHSVFPDLSHPQLGCFPPQILSRDSPEFDIKRIAECRCCWSLIFRRILGLLDSSWLFIRDRDVCYKDRGFGWKRAWKAMWSWRSLVQFPTGSRHSSLKFWRRRMVEADTIKADMHDFEDLQKLYRLVRGEERKNRGFYAEIAVYNWLSEAQRRGKYLYYNWPSGWTHCYFADHVWYPCKHFISQPALLNFIIAIQGPYHNHFRTESLYGASAQMCIVMHRDFGIVDTDEQGIIPMGNKHLICSMTPAKDAHRPRPKKACCGRFLSSSEDHRVAFKYYNLLVFSQHEIIDLVLFI